MCVSCMHVNYVFILYACYVRMPCLVLALLAGRPPSVFVKQLINVIKGVGSGGHTQWA